MVWLQASAARLELLRCGKGSQKGTLRRSCGEQTKGP